ncbi:MAG: septal ring lytic transglycosylase RlpA family protein [Filomicrobium sp.]
MSDFTCNEASCNVVQKKQTRRLKTAFLTVLTALLFTNFVTPPAEAKRPGSTYCFVGKCHRVKTLNETRSLVGKTVPLVASHYSDCSKDRFNPCGLTSSGEAFHPDRPDNAASPIYPDGTVLLVRNPKTKASAVLRINNAGPYWGNRKLDVSEAAARKLGFRQNGVAKLETKILSAPNKQEARYSRRRKYRQLPGFIGKFDNLKDAERTAVALMMLDATAASVIAPSNSAAMLTAARGETATQRKKRLRDRKKLEPILKTMRLISDLNPSTAKPSSVAEVTITDRRSTLNQTASLRPSRLHEAASPKEAVSPNTERLAAETSAPSHQLAKIAVEELSAEFSFLEHRAKRAPTQLIRTAEVGTPSNDAWEDLLRARLGSLSGNNIWGGTLPYRPLPSRAPRKVIPGTPNLARNEVAG